MKFSDVLEIKNGRNQKQVENPNGKYPIYGSGGIMGYADDYICEPYTVIIGRKGTINNPIYVETPFWNVDTAFGLQAKKDILHPKYLYYFCVHFDFEALNTTVTIPSLTKANLLNIDIPLPPLAEQTEIVDTLTSVDELIKIKKQQLELFDELTKSRFIELFGDPVLNPKGFVEGSVSEYCKMTQGTQIPMSEQINEYQQGYYRYLYIRDLKYNDSDWIYVQDKYDDKKLTEKDLVVVNTGNTAGEIYYGKDGILSNNLFKVSFDADVLNTTYMFAYFSSQQFQSMLWSEMKEGTQPHLGHKIFGSKKLIIPPMDLQSQFAAFVEQADKSKLAVQQSIAELEELKKSLMQKYFG